MELFAMVLAEKRREDRKRPDPDVDASLMAFAESHNRALAARKARGH